MLEASELRTDPGRAHHPIGRLPPRGLMLLLGCALPAVLFGRPTIAAIVALHPLATSPSPYFVPDRMLLLYVAAPLVFLSTCCLLLVPGLFVAFRFCRDRTLPDWIVTGFTCSFAIVSLAAGVAQELIGRPIVGAGFVWLVLGLAALALAAHGPRRSPGLPEDRANGWSGLSLARGHGAMLAVAAAMVVIAFIAFLPKVFWENFNGDGAHMFETARLLLHQPLPFWPASAGELATYPSIKSMLAIYPTSWFVRLFGSNEAAARLPCLLLLPVLFCAMIAVIEEERSSRLRWPDLAMLAGALLLFTLVMAFSATEDPYLADLALPAVQDVLLMIFWCGFMLHFLRRETGPMIGYMALVYLTSPNALPLLGAWWLAALICLRPVPRTRLIVVALATMALLILEILLARLLVLAGLPAPGSEHGTSDLMRRLLHPQFGQLIRLAWAFVPVGLLPGVALLMWPRQDRTTRMVAVCALIMFAFYYFQYRFSLHYFVPVMILSLIVLWRVLPALPGNARRFAPAVTGAATLLCFVLSWPSDWRPATGSREVGEQIEDRTSGYQAGDPAALGRANVLQALFPRPSDPRVPRQLYGGHPLVWLHYAHVPVDDPRPRSYVLQWRPAPAIPGARKIAESGTVAVYVRDEELRARQAARRLPDPTGARIYVVPRQTLFTNGPRLAALQSLKEFCQRNLAWCPGRSNKRPPAGDTPPLPPSGRR